MNDKQLPEGLSEILEQKARVSKAARNAIGFLFPVVREKLGGFFSMSDSGTTARIDRRIANRDFTSSYFRLEPATQTWGKAEIEKIASREDPELALREVERRVQLLPKKESAELLRLLFEQLEDYFDSGKTVFSEAWFSAIILYSPVYIRSYNPSDELLFSFDNITRLHRLLYRGMKQLTVESRASYYRMGIGTADDISLLCSYFRTVVADLRKEGGADADSAVTFGAYEQEIRELLLEKVKSFASANKIWVQAAPDRILWFWWANELTDDIMQFTSGQMGTAEGQRNLMEFSLSLVRSTDGNYERVPRVVGRILDLDRLQSIAENIVSDGGAGAELAGRFVKGLERSDAGPFGEY